MSGYFNLNAQRTISSANKNIYNCPTNHPDRIMAEHDLVYIVSGSWKIYQDGIPYLLEKDDVIILFSGQHHYGIDPCEIGTQTYYLHINADANDFFCESDYNETLTINTLIHCQNNLYVKVLFENIVKTFFMDIVTQKERLSALSQLLLCELQDYNELTSNIDSVLDIAVSHIHANKYKPISSSELAKLAFVSERTLRNHFLKTYKKTPYQYQVDLRLENVRAMLAYYPQIPLKEVAINFDFCDEFHLSKVFKDKFGISPSEYRKKYYWANIKSAQMV